MAVEITKNINSPECIRCGKCKTICQAGAISSGFMVEYKERYKRKRSDEEQFIRMYLEDENVKK